MTDWKDVKGNRNRWMGFLPDSTKLSEMSIPGTHDTMTWEGTSAPGDLSRTQRRPLSRAPRPFGPSAGQLDVGVRFLDIRLGLYDRKEMGFALFHGKDDIRYDNNYEYTHTDLDGNKTRLRGGRKFFQEAVLETCIDFLKANPSECIVMSVKRDQFDNKESFKDKFEKKVRENSNWFYTENKIPTLGEVRGKIVLVRRYAPGTIGINAYGSSRWPDNDDQITDVGNMRLAVNDHYNERNIYRKFRGVRSYLKKADDDILVFNFVSIAGQFVPPFWIHDPEYYANKINPRLQDHLDMLGAPNKLGIVIVDYIEWPLADSIVRTNFEHPRLMWFEGRYCTQDSWSMELEDGYRQNLKKTSAYPNDEFSSLQLQSVPAGWEITVYDNPDGKTNDDYCRIRTKKYSGVYNVNDFERDSSDSRVSVDYREDNGLKGKVSHVRMRKL
uniref:1-phosphatidylinositol phosphodiesterase n=1 Tax=Candidatus Kentrum sp. TC TaxID=2126339 RepID=A0A450YET4_9GAMM|nr:MAG: 1-phosphatidylinositol phosphodiesterase [Candidatus Kentron sp. TC]